MSDRYVFPGWPFAGRNAQWARRWAPGGIAHRLVQRFTWWLMGLLYEHPLGKGQWVYTEMCDHEVWKISDVSGAPSS